MATATKPRARLSRELILSTAMELIDAEGDDALTFRHLGKMLGSDPTAVYRYFRNKDELLLAMADELIAGAIQTLPDSDDWRVMLRGVAAEGYRSAIQHPRLAVLIASRTTQGEAETAAIERVLAALNLAGFDPEESVTIWRAFADSMLAWGGLTAAFMTLPVDVQEKDVNAWTGRYASADSEQFPHLHAAAPHIAASADKDFFTDAMEIMLDGIAARLASRPTKGST